MQEEKEQKRNTMLFFAFTFLIMLGYPYIFGGNTSQQQNIPLQESTQIANSSRGSINIVPSLPIEEEKNIVIEAPRIYGNISTKGAQFSDIVLKNYKTEYNSNNKVSVFGDRKYFAMTSWFAEDKSVKIPDENSYWKANQLKLTSSTPVILTWDNHEGLLFTKIIRIDENFVFTITDTVKNYGNKAVKLNCSAKIYREIEENPDSVGFYSGPIGYFNKDLNEVAYKDIEKKKVIEYSSCGGWFGITDKYWLVSFIPEANFSYDISYNFVPLNEHKGYRIESKYNAVNVEPAMEVAQTQHLFIGAKEIKTLDMYEEKLNVPHLDLVIDFGYLYVLTKPLLYAVSYMKNLVGNMGWGILLITLILKLILFPLANKSYRSMNRMKDIQPKIKALQEKYGNDQVRLGQAVSELYKKEKLNPMGGCLPMFLQWPILFALYKVLYISIEMRQAPFFGWIHDLSIADPWVVLTLGGLIPLPLPSFLEIGIWPLLMGLSMWIQQKMGPAPADPAQGKVMLIMPIMFTFMFGRLPAGLVIYWTFSNLLGILQQYIIKRVDEKNRAVRLKNIEGK